jgi:ring-1,2-phenylacetyl-CoA epoxidase subunit PaaC
MNNESLLKYVLHLADNVLILGQRLGEWCGHGPVLEQDIALTNISLDLIGQSRMYYQYAAELEGKGRTEDDMAFLRDAWDFYNIQLVEQPNGDWAHTMMRQFLFDSWHIYFLNALSQSKDERLAAIAAKSLKEVQYHLRFSSEWILRMGDGTDESHQRAQAALEQLWAYSGEPLKMADYENELLPSGISVDLQTIENLVHNKRIEIIQEATLSVDKSTFMQGGGKHGIHTEHLGFILAEMQYMQRAYPGQVW